MFKKGVISLYCVLVALLVPVISSSRQFHFSNKIKQNNTDEYRRNIIRDEFLWVYMNYKSRGFGFDELRPVSGKVERVTWGGWGVSLVDCLDTLWLMGLYEEFQDAVVLISKLDFTRGHHTTSFFEITIRYLGGLLSAYDLSKNKILLSKAKDLGNLVLNDFDSNSGLPYTYFDFYNKKSVKENYVGLANIGSFQMEFAHLSKLTGNPKYLKAALHVYKVLESHKKGDGIYNNDLNIETGEFTSKAVSFGGGADSFYEYLLKLHILFGPSDSHKELLAMFSDSMDTLKSLLRTVYDGRLALGQLNQQGEFVESFHHLTFFVPGMLLMADKYLPDKNLTLIALDLLDTFYHVVEISPTKLAPESIRFSKYEDLSVEDHRNILRPELLESLFYAYKYTGKHKYQKQTWKIFKAFVNYSKSNFGFAEYNNVYNLDPKGQHGDVMQSFFLAETFKYAYLSFNHDIIDLEKWVFTTEAHPLRVHE